MTTIGRMLFVFGRQRARKSMSLAMNTPDLQLQSSIFPYRVQYYSISCPRLNDEKTISSSENSKDDVDMKKVSMEFNNRRASYRRQVSALRKLYFEDYIRHTEQDEAERDAERAEITRRRLERQRAKNERSVENARRQEELRRQAALAFQDHLRIQQEKRDAKKDLVRRARQLLIDELEEEAHLWLATPEEIDTAFTEEAEQLLWAFPQGVVGAPNPSLDSHFWNNYEGHTWDMSKTYKTQSQILLEEFEENAYWATNIDPTVWTPERIEERETLERKAKLRANLRMEGRRSLLKRQMEYLNEENQSKPGEPPKPVPVPSLGVLADTQAQEKEGAELLRKDPAKFFIFDKNESPGSTLPTANNSTKEQQGDNESHSYSGPSLGTPVGIRDPLRTGQPQGRVFPIGIGKLPKPDTRTEKEKKRQEREERMWAAAQAQAQADSDEIELVAEEDREIGEPIDYDNNDDWDSDDEEWIKGLDPDLDSDVISVPREYRYREEDIDFVIEKLEEKAEVMHSHVRNTVQTMEQEARSRMGRTDDDTLGERTDDEQESKRFFDDATSEKLQSIGVDVDKYESLMASLTNEQLLSLFGLEAQRREAIEEDGSPSSIFEEIPGLTEEQIVGLTELESFMQVLENSDGSSTIQ